MKQPSDKGYCIAVVGAGAMGQGIAQVCAMGSIRTLLFDASDGAATKARERIIARIDRLAEKGNISAADAEEMAACLETVDTLEAIAPADTVVEAVFEDIEIKQSLFREIENCVRDDCIIASNTSSIPIASIASACVHRGRVAGMHFFNPVPLMKLVEVIRGPETEPGVISILSVLGEQIGRTPVVVKDAPGFLVNLGGRAYTTEGLRIAHDNIASPAAIDAIMRDCCGFPMGPFELMDLTGIDVNYPVTSIVCSGYMNDARLRTSPLHKALFDAGRFGRKTKAGHYLYDDEGKMIDPPSPDFAIDGEAATEATLAEPDDRLKSFCAEIGVKIISEDSGDIPVLAAPLGEDCTHLALRTGVDPRRLVALDIACDTSTRVTLMTAPGAGDQALNQMAAAIIQSGRRVTAIKDSPGFVSQRLGAMIANLGCYMAEIELASLDDIDLAMRLGLNYPRGPFEMVEHFGAKETLKVLEQLQAITGEDRYRPTLWLKRRALLGLDIRTPA